MKVKPVTCDCRYISYYYVQWQQYEQHIERYKTKFNFSYEFFYRKNGMSATNIKKIALNN